MPIRNMTKRSLVIIFFPLTLSSSTCAPGSVSSPRCASPGSAGSTWSSRVPSTVRCAADSRMSSTCRPLTKWRQTSSCYLEPGRIFGRVHLENVLVLHGQSLGESGNSLEWVEGSSLWKTRRSQLISPFLFLTVTMLLASSSLVISASRINIDKIY